MNDTRNTLKNATEHFRCEVLQLRRTYRPPLGPARMAVDMKGLFFFLSDVPGVCLNKCDIEGNQVLEGFSLSWTCYL